jgi:SNARE protein
MATDRIIMIFVFLIVLGVVGAILVNVLQPNTKLGSKVQTGLQNIPVFNITGAQPQLG